MCKALIPFIGILFTVPATSQKTILTEWLGQDNLEIQLTADWHELYASRDEEYRDAIMIWNGIETEVELRLRGRYRRAQCTSKPLMIKFKKTRFLEEHGFLREFNNVKIVSHCEAGETYTENVYEELLVYKLYEILSPYSMRTGPMWITYAWPNDRGLPERHIALALEQKQECAWRLGGTEVEDYYKTPDSLDATNHNVMAMFQFMVGNYDWSTDLVRNALMIETDTNYLFIPYDFDFSAIVIPDYARLSPDWPQQSFEDRIYLGKHFLDELPQMREYFIAKKEELFSYIESYEYLSGKRKNQIERYLNKFYKFIEKPENEMTYGTILRTDGSIDQWVKE